MSQLQNKSGILRKAADLLHQEGLYAAVAHSAYYCCLQISKHLWLYPMRKTQDDLSVACAENQTGTHAILINATRNYIKNSGKTGCSFDSRDFHSKIGQLKRLREDADYADMVIVENDSKKAIMLSNDLHPILEKYL